MDKTLLRQEQLRTLLKEFKDQYAERYHLQALGYFGSHARKEAVEDSDVDIVFDSYAPNLFDTAMMKQDLEAFLGRPVDLLRLRGLTNAKLRARIEKEVIYV